ncbi:hypothetical protein GHK29_18040 [Sinorhizobium medicae]|uniref:3-hydroxyacyl-CoA dehydrogenase family protein n=1 Tax=Sinorhizobium medicae TaxID=110321 RepID=UPI001294D4AF|nr:hypothetical protein [Sinorhizobium medicae]MQU76484.1 hypothetical protein [Sinorhizobium medicae]
MKSLSLSREIAGYIGNLIQFAVLREILYLLSQGVADLEAIDRASTAGPTIRWAVMGPSSVFYLGTRDPIPRIRQSARASNGKRLHRSSELQARQGSDPRQGSDRTPTKYAVG